MARLWPSREQAPILFTCFCGDWLRLPVPLTALWWQALQRARWSRAVALRSLVLCQTALATDWQHLLHLYEDTMTPAALILVLEELVAENLLSPLPARRIEEHVLTTTNQHGQWKGTR
jgi:hypothetical protein